MILCRRCKTEKQREAFSRDRTRPGGVSYWCKSCVATNAKAWRETKHNHCKIQSAKYYLTNRERILQQQKERRARDPARVHAIEKRWRDANPEKVSARGYLWAKENPEKRRAAKIRYLKTENGRLRSCIDASKRRAMMRNALDETAGPITAEWFQEVIAQQRGQCFYCFGTQDLEMEHLIPLARGGKHSRTNIVAACFRCNRSKHDKLPNEWRAG